MASIAKYRDGYRAQVYVKGVRRSQTFRTQREAGAWAASIEHKLTEVMKQRAEILGKEEATKFTGMIGITEMSNSQVKHHPVGVYVLFNEGVCVYVGKSKNVLSRIAAHYEKGREFTHYFVIPCTDDEIDSIEQKYITSLCPKQNLKV